MTLTDEIRGRRVAVAKDVLAQVATNRVNVISGFGYLSPQFGTRPRLAELLLANEDNDLKSIVDDVAPHCNVCALGAMVLSKARMYNAVQAKSLMQKTYNFGDVLVNLNKDQTVELLADTFDPLTLDMIEAAFECSDLTDLYEEDDGYEKVVRSIKFGKDVNDSRGEAEDRIVAVMENIITNNGEFQP